MTKRKGIVSKVVLVLVVLTLISGCFVGTTLARYASQGSGSATTSVANWRVSITGNAVSGSAPMAFSDLSPSDEPWSSGVTSDAPRKHSTGKKLVATIVNAGEVDATVTVSVDTTDANVKVYGLSSDSNAASTTEVSFGGEYSKATVLDLFTVDLYYGTTEGASNATNTITSGTALRDALAPEHTYYIYAEVTWTTADSGEDGTAGDALDTWVGNNVGSIVYNLSYTAVQASKTAVQASEEPADAGA